MGLGGRLDATNVVDPLLSVITDIALDHQEWLGETLTEIAGEKCGILRPNSTLITLPQHPEVNTAVGVAATSLAMRAVSAAQYVPLAERNGESLGDATLMGVPLRNRYTVELDDVEPGQVAIDSPLVGQHQRRNIALAITAAVELRNKSGYKLSKESNNICYNITNPAISAGIRDTFWPGRLEFLPPNLLLDVAHNPAGLWTLRSALSALPDSRPRTLIFSCLRDKNLLEMSRILFPLFDSSNDGDPMRRHDHILLAPIASSRAAAVEDLLAAAHALGVPAHAAPHLPGALSQARQITPQGGLIVATGSVYLVGEIRHLAMEAQP